MEGHHQDQQHQHQHEYEYKYKYEHEHEEVSSSKINGGKKNEQVVVVEKRSSREARRMAMEDYERGRGRDGDINQLAEDFIKNFRKQLKIQREDSLKRFREMIARGT
ncbi:hypothetical protein ACSBR1_034447 [Camellia fascicularis]